MRHPTLLTVLLALLTLSVGAGVPGQASAQCSNPGTPVQQGCGDHTWEGCCDGEDLYWCEDGWLCYADCGQMEGHCGWEDEGQYYNCWTDGDHAPGNNPPMECPAEPNDDADGDGWDADEDCNDNDPAVNPGADEDCDNGIDDDCDGQIDVQDPDCQGGDDDDDASDDDDDDAGDDDAGDDDGQGDDDTPPGDGGPMLVAGEDCSCSAAGSAGGASFAAMLIAVGLLGWRRAR